MDNREAIVKVLSRCGCQNAKQISCLCKRWYGHDVSPGAASGTLRAMIDKEEIGSSNCGNGATVYWLLNKEDKYGES